MPGRDKVVLVTGAWQVGRTTTLRERLGDRFGFGYALMETPRDCVLAKRDATLFLESKNLPLVIEEVRRISESLSPVRWIANQSEEKGRIVLTESQTCRLMRGPASLSRAGSGSFKCHLWSSGRSWNVLTTRIPMFPMRSTSRKNPMACLVSGGPSTGDRCKSCGMDQSTGTPSARLRERCLERDVRDPIDVRGEAKPHNLMVVCATRSGQLLDASDISNAGDADHKMVKAGMSVLQASNITRIARLF